ncbi:MAG: cupin domain-containing protein [Anaerolineae bacterium]|nr:cupin domain-containing protein [Anaerolineae bacterium]
MINVINLAQKFTLFAEQWSPRIVGELNDAHVKLVKIQGEFIWHHHDHEDELFLVMQGRMLMHLREADANGDPIETEKWVEAGELIIIPRGIEHKPAAEDECYILLLEPKTTVNTGSEADGETGSARTVEAEWI